MSNPQPTAAIDGRLWWKGDRIVGNNNAPRPEPCVVVLNEDARPGNTVQGRCEVCDGTHYVAADDLGTRWQLADTVGAGP